MSGGLLPARGRAGALLMMTVERELVASDFVNAAANPGDRIAPGVIQKLHARHHRAARLIAEGKTVQQVAALTDYTAQRISDLANKDPAFRELVARYQGSITDASLDAASAMQAKLIDVGTLAVDEIRERLEDDGERAKMNIDALRQVAQFATDRTVAPPRTAIPGSTVPARITFNIGTRDIRPTTTIESNGSQIVEVTSDEQEQDTG